jgi:DNA-binding GntR family transcriptional regulator
MDEAQIKLLATAMDTACTTMSHPYLAALQDSLDRACAISAKAQWERKAAAHAEFFTVLAGATSDPHAALVLRRGARLSYDLMIAAGRAADFIVINSRKRVLASLRAGDASEASVKMEEHLRLLRFIWRLAQCR